MLLILSGDQQFILQSLINITKQLQDNFWKMESLNLPKLDLQQIKFGSNCRVFFKVFEYQAEDIT